MDKTKRIVILAATVLFLAGFVWSCVWVVTTLWSLFKTMNIEVAAGLLSAVIAVLGATVTVMLSRHFEREKDREAAYRQRKTEIYDEFLKEFFRVFHDPGQNDAAPDDRLVSFLREWQRKMILWGGQDVLKAYIEWMRRLRSGTVDASTIFMTEDFFRAIRQDLGHSSSKLPRGTFVHLLLREADLFLAVAQKRPDISLAELVELEKAGKNPFNTPSEN